MTMTVERERFFEGDEFEVVAQLTADAPVTYAVRLELPRGMWMVSETLRCTGAAIDAELRWRVRAESWGHSPVGPVVVVAHSEDLLSQAEVRSSSRRVTVFPVTEALARPPLPRTLPNRLGNHTSRTVGEGIEFAGIRPLGAGDSVRRLNWRASARFQRPFITQLHVERSCELVLVVDSYSDVGPSGHTSLDVSIRSAASVAQFFLAANDRVGLVAMGGVLRWVSAESGSRHYVRILQSLLDTHDTVTVVRPALERLPRVVLPAGALVVLFSPLLDERAVQLARDLRERRFPLVVVDVLTADPYVDRTTAASGVALQMWRLQRRVMCAQLADIGAHVIPWDGTGSLDAVFAALPTGGRVG